MIIGLKEPILQSLWQAVEGLFGYNAAIPELIWTKLGI